jgi:hypothetical protein
VAVDGVVVLYGMVTRGASSGCRFVWDEFVCFQIGKGTDRFELWPWVFFLKRGSMGAKKLQRLNWKEV